MKKQFFKKVISDLFFLALILAVLITCEKPERVISFITIDALDADISYTTAILKGEIIDAGSQPVDDYGIVYSTDPNPRIGNGTPKSAGTSLKKGEFSITVTGLTKNTLYYFRAYVTIDDDDVHADKIYSFTTKDTQIPTVIAGSVSEITMTSASLNGEVTSDGGETNTTRGLCWGTSANPTLTSCLDTTVNGSGTGTFTGKITGLTAGTQYYARTYAINAKGTSYNSADVIFKTHNLPAVATSAVSGISGTGASSGGEVTDTGGVAVTARGVCWSTASGPTADLTTKTTDGPGQGSFTSSITGLTLATTYYLRAYATNKYGTSYGSELTFSTLQEPGAVTTAATGITTASATLNGSVNANNSETAVSFQYGTTTSYGSTIAATPGAVTGNTSTSISASLSSLTPGTTYHYRVRALSEAGEIFGADQEFTTLKLPSAATLSATTVTGSTATLNGTVNANNSATTVTFEYGLTTAYGTEAAALQSPVTGTTSTAVSADLTGLTPGQEYHYRVKAVSAAGTAYGDDKTLTTSMTSAATTNAATAVGNTTATLNGIVNAAGSSTTVSFEYGTSTSYGTTVTALQSPVTGTANTAVSAAITGLTPGLNYHFRVKAVSGGGTTYGSDLTFTTLQPPAAATSAATAVSSTSATLNGTADANNSSTTVTFEYGETTSYGTGVAADQSPVTGDTETSVSKAISGLSASTTYHYRVKAVSAGGTVYGNDAEFTTSADLPTVSDYEGNIYNIITIGTQEWMQKNLMVTHYSTGDAISNVTDNTAWSGLTTDAFCWYNNDQAAYKGTYGALYNWYTVIDVRNVCPAGWHVPTDAEWTTLTTYLGGISAAGGKLKESGTAHWASPNEGATNETGFTALPGGNRYFNGAFEYTGSIGDWWSFSGTDATMALSRGMYHHIGSVSVDNHDKRIGFSIRCLKGSLPLSGTIAATAVSSSSVTLNGKVNPNDASTTVTFEYGTTTAYGSTATASQNPVSGTTPVDVSAGLSGLNPGTEYHFRVKAVNPGGTSYGGDMIFTTTSLPAPAATTGSATGVSSTSAVLNGMVNANGLSTAVTFEYGTSTSYGTEVAASESPVSGSSETPVSVGLSGLTPSTTYHYRVKAVSSGGTTYGDDMMFGTYLLPTITTKSISNINSTTATSGGTVTSDGGSAVTGRGICWSFSSDPTINDSKTSDGIGLGTFTSYLTNLLAGTTYHVRAYATNLAGTAYGNDEAFTTINIPTVYTSAITNITSTSATTGGNITNDGGLTVSERGVCWSTSPNPTISNSKTVDGSGTGPYTSSLTDLTISTTFYVRAYATNSLGTSYGEELSFFTPTLPTISTNAVTQITSATAFSGGNISNDGGGVITSRGVCWSTTEYPTIDNNKSNDGTGTGSYESYVIGLDASTVYYIRAYATNNAGTGYGDQISIYTESGLSIGSHFQGGIVYYLDGTNEHGLICAPSIYTSQATWGCYGTNIPGAEGYTIGTGAQNTLDILAGCTTTGIAAEICANFELDGYDDWFLPSSSELELLKNNRNLVGGFYGSWYFSSTEHQQLDYQVLCYHFSLGLTTACSKNYVHYVRPVRAF